MEKIRIGTRCRIIKRENLLSHEDVLIMKQLNKNKNDIGSIYIGVGKIIAIYTSSREAIRLRHKSIFIEKDNTLNVSALIAMIRIQVNLVLSLRKIC